MFLVSEKKIADYGELHCLSSFSFLRGASQPQELATRAVELGYKALAITDECSVAGVVRAHTALRETPTRLIVGSECRLSDARSSDAKPTDGPLVVALAADRAGYARLSRFITRGRRQAPKGEYRVSVADAFELLTPPHVLLLWAPTLAELQEPSAAAFAEQLMHHGAGSAWLAVELLRDGTEQRHLQLAKALSERSGLPLVATGGACMHRRERRRLHDALTAIRLRTTVDAAGLALLPSGERHLRERERLARLYPPSLLQETLAIAERCQFSLDELRYEYPRELVPDSHTPASWLRTLVERGAERRWGGNSASGNSISDSSLCRSVPAQVRALIEHELALISELSYEAYFLTVHDIVDFARSRGILCQGRGSAANSVVCYCLGITEVDPSRMSVLFERFISRERNEPPDIDVDFEHERREEVIQYLYAKYGRHRAALAATVISYRPRSTLRDLGRALGFDPIVIESIAKSASRWDKSIDIARLELPEKTVDIDRNRLHLLFELAEELLGFPRHLSQHVGGFVIARDSLEELVPIENASMPDRTVIQWDKDDLDALGLLKVDVLALGMLTAIRRAIDLISVWRCERGGEQLTLPAIPAEDPKVYDMLCRADSVGVFQIESRAQMNMLPRLRPRCFYDLVIEVAIVRPGPIQGDMVHPYLRRRRGEESISYPSEAVKSVLERTLGVPIFQEQVMQLAIAAAGFSPGEADQLRRAMAAWKRRGGLGHFEERLIRGMRERGYTDEFAQRVFAQIQGFGEYGFPESHAASFALLVYVSAWLKCHEPAAFTAALLNSQPMGFYSPSQLVRDAREHGVEVRPVDVLKSDWDCTLEAAVSGKPAIRLGLRLVHSLTRAGAERVVAVRDRIDTLQDLVRYAELDRGDLEALAAAGACANLSGNRHQAFWSVAGTEVELPLAPCAEELALPLLPVPTEGENLVADYRALGLTLGRHPLALLRSLFAPREVSTASQLSSLPSESPVSVAGLVTMRQRPGTASGVTFVTLEDDTGYVNLIVWKRIGAQYRRELLHSRLLEAEGYLQREGEVLHVIVDRLHDRSAWLGRLTTRSRDFR
ncbi:MAG: error-prone DNA polymerase [Steroidobacteraceae bacterium]